MKKKAKINTLSMKYLRNLLKHYVYASLEIMKISVYIIILGIWKNYVMKMELSLYFPM